MCDILLLSHKDSPRVEPVTSEELVLCVVWGGGGRAEMQFQHCHTGAYRGCVTWNFTSCEIKHFINISWFFFFLAPKQGRDRIVPDPHSQKKR